MKARVRVFKILAGIAVPMFVAGGVAHAGSNEPEEIPLPAGQFSNTAQGSQAICLNSVGVLEDCSTSGAAVIPINILDNGAGSIDSKGNSCFTVTESDSALPVNAIPPVLFLFHTVGKVIRYDSATGIGDTSFSYSGGQCTAPLSTTPARQKVLAARTTSL